MPYYKGFSKRKYGSKKKTKKTNRKYSSGYYKKKGKYAKASKDLTNSLINADRLFVKLPWDWRYTSNVAGTGAGRTTYVFQVNSVYDPYYPSASTDSALGLALYAQMFQKYIVRGVKVKLRVTTTTQDSNSLINVSCGFSNNADSMNDKPITQYSQNPYFVSADISGLGSPGKFRYKKYMGIKKLPGLAGDLKQYDEYTATVVASPNAGVFFIVCIQRIDSPTNQVNYLLEVSMRFYTEFYARRSYGALIQPNETKSTELPKKQMYEVDIKPVNP